MTLGTRRLFLWSQKGYGHFFASRRISLVDSSASELTSRLHDSSVQMISYACQQYQPAQSRLASPLPIAESAFFRSSEALVSVTWKRPLSAALSQTAKVRLIDAAAAPHSGAFFNACRCLSLGTRMDRSTLRIAVGLGLDVLISAPHDCVCGAAVDCLGTRDQSCREAAGRSSRHRTQFGQWRDKTGTDSSGRSMSSGAWRRQAVDGRSLSRLGLDMSCHVRHKSSQPCGHWCWSRR